MQFFFFNSQFMKVTDFVLLKFVVGSEKIELKIKKFPDLFVCVEAILFIYQVDW